LTRNVPETALPILAPVMLRPSHKVQL